MERAVSVRCWIRPRPVDDPAVRLVCLPHAGRGGTLFRSWANLLPDGVDLYGITPPGRESRFAEPLPSTMDELVAGLSEALAPVLAGPVPVVLVGHSMGALVAFELARRSVGAAGVGPAALVVSGCPPPHHPAPGPVMSGLDDDAFLGRLRRLGGTPEELLDNAEAREVLLPVLRADYRLAEDYAAGLLDAPPTPLDRTITVLEGDRDPETAAGAWAGWAELTTGECTRRRFPGGHFFLEESRSRVVAAVTSTLLPHLVT